MNGRIRGPVGTYGVKLRVPATYSQWIPDEVESQGGRRQRNGAGKSEPLVS